jgi:hypothetical protein
VRQNSGIAALVLLFINKKLNFRKFFDKLLYNSRKIMYNYVVWIKEVLNPEQ